MIMLLIIFLYYMQIIPKRIIIILALIEQYICLNHLVENNVERVLIYSFSFCLK